MNHLFRTIALVIAAFLPLIPAAEAVRKRSALETGPSIRSLRSGLAHVGYTASTQQAVGVGWLGTGFLVDRRCTVVTAKHILQDAPGERLVVRFEHPQKPGTALTFNARLAAEDPDRDLAYLSLDELPGGGSPCTAAGLRPLPLVESIDPDRLAGEEVLILGFPVLEGEQPREIPIVRRGSVASAELTWGGKTMLLLDLTGVPGFSGAPVILRETGEAIGVVFGPGRTQRLYDLEWATPLTRSDARRAGRN
jgi:hypothetical protein